MIYMLVRWGSLLGGLNKPATWNDPCLRFYQKTFGFLCLIMVVNVEGGGGQIVHPAISLGFGVPELIMVYRSWYIYNWVSDPSNR